MIAGYIVSFSYVAGYSLDHFFSLDILQPTFYLQWFLGGIPAAGLTYGVFCFAESRETKKLEGRTIPMISAIVDRHVGRVVILLLFWLPALLSLFPGAFAYDAYNEWEQMALGNITSHHPVIHVLWLGGLVEGFHSLTGSYNVGIAVYSIMQMVILANMLSYTIGFMREFKIPDGFQFFSLLFYGASPVMQMFSISAVKDVIFSASLLLFFLCALRICCEGNRFWTSKKNMALFVSAAFLSMTLRHNGFYVVVISLAAMLVKSLLKREELKIRAMAFSGGIILLLYGIYAGPVYHFLKVTPGGIEEMLSVPLQQMARVHRYDMDSLEQQDLELLYSVIPKDNLDTYRSTVSDFVKEGFNREAYEENKGAFFRLWLKWGVSHPLTYLNSFLVNTVDFWYPGAVIDGYQHADGRSSYFDYSVDRPGTEIVFLPRLHDFYEKLSFDPEAQRKPFAFLLLNPGWYFQIFFILFMYVLCCRKKMFAQPMMILVLLFLTVMLGPMALVRYVLVFYYGFPVFISIFMYGAYYERSVRNCSEII